MTGCSILEGTKPTQEIELLVAEFRNLHPTIGPGQDRTEYKQQDFIQRILHLYLLAGVGQK